MRVSVLITRRVNVNVQDKDSGWTALHWAVHNNDKSMLVLLLQARANPNIREYYNGDIPINFACTRNYTNLIERLLKAKSWLKHKNRHGETLLQAAGKAGHRTIVDWLLKLGAHKQEPAAKGVHKQYLGTKADGVTQRTERMLLSQLYPAVQEYNGSYNKIPETAEERYERERAARLDRLYGPQTQPHPEKWEAVTGPRSP